MLIANKLQIRHSETTEINGFGLNNWLRISKSNLTFLLFIAQHVHDFQNLSNADRTKSSTFCPNLIQLNLPRNITHVQEVKNNTHPRTGGLHGLCTQIFPSVCDTSCYSPDELANRDNWSSLVSPASSQVLNRAVYPILHQPGFTCGSRDFCNSFHSISIVSDMIHALQLQGKKSYLGTLPAWRVTENTHSCSWKVEEGEQKMRDRSWIQRRHEPEKEPCYCGWGVHRPVIHSITGPIWHAKREDDERSS